MWRYLLLRNAEWLAHLVPRRMAYGIARRFADLYVLFDRRGREAVMGNLDRIHRHSGVALAPRSLRALARENFLNFAKYIVDFFRFNRPEPEQLRGLVEFGNMTEVLDRLLAHGKGVITITAHFGNWELGGAALAALGYKFNVVALWQPDPRLNRLYQRQRIARRLNPIPMGRAARECIAALRRGEIVALLGDRDFTGSRETTQFFGQPARLPQGPAKLALATGAPLVPVFLIRRPDDTFAYLVQEPIWADRNRDTVADIMQRLAQAMEQAISQHSEQWYLFHNLWDIEADRRMATIAAFGAAPADDQESSPRQKQG